MYNSIPDKLRELNTWTRCQNKRPFIPPNGWDNALSFSQVDSFQEIGILLSPENEVCVIDVDFGNAKDKRACAQARDAAGFDKTTWGSEEYFTWLYEHTNLIQSVLRTPFASLLTHSYAEVSPSGLGLHLFFTLEGKDQYKEASKKSRSQEFAGQVSLQNAFMTVTGIPLHGCASEISALTPADLEEVFDFRVRQEKTSDIVFPEITRVTKEEVCTALAAIPLGAEQEKTVLLWEKLTGRKYEHYDFWITVGMALHDYGLKTQQAAFMYALWLDWSRGDAECFKGEQDIETKWRSFNANSSGVTVGTILALGKKLVFKYPKPLYRKGKATDFPDTVEYDNFSYLMKYYGLEIWEDDAFYISGSDEEVNKKFFGKCKSPLMKKYYGPYNLKEIESFCLVLCQASGWKNYSSASQLTNIWINHTLKPLDLFKEWIDTPFEELPDKVKSIKMLDGTTVLASSFNCNSSVEYLFACLNTRHRSEQERVLYASMFKKWLMQIIKFREDYVLELPFVDNGGMLILSGEENTYKSTFCKLLMPLHLDSVRKEINTPLVGDKAVRDFLRYFSTKSIVQMDEFESIMDTTSSFCKNLLSGNDPSFVDIYGTKEVKRVRKAVVIGTTNKEKMPMNEEGSRRIWFIPVGQIDTISARKINLHKLYNDLRIEFRKLFSLGQMPWLLTQDEITLLNKLNGKIALGSDLSIALEEIYPTKGVGFTKDYIDFDNPARMERDNRLASSKQIRILLEAMGYGKIKLTALEHAIERHCALWTGSTKSPIEEKRGVYMFKKGRLSYRYNEHTGQYAKTMWVVPPRSNHDD